MINNKNYTNKNNSYLTSKSVENETEEEEEISEEDQSLYKLINKFKNSNGN